MNPSNDYKETNVLPEKQLSETNNCNSESNREEELENQFYNCHHFEFDYYERGKRILIETTNGTVFDGFYSKTESTGLNGRIRVNTSREFPWNSRHDSNHTSLFYAKEVKTIRFFKNDVETSESTDVITPFSKILTFDDFDYWRDIAVSNQVYISIPDKNFHNAMEYLSEIDEISVEMLGCHIDFTRNTNLSLLIIGTKEKTFIFDLINSTKKFFDYGLRKLLENERIRKIVYDSRILADCLYHRCFKTYIHNTIDLQILDYCNLEKRNRVKRYKDFRNLPEIAEEYLDLPVGVFRDSEFLKTDHIMYKRPIPSDVKDFAALTVAFFFLLRDALEFEYAKELYDCMEMYANAENVNDDLLKAMVEVTEGLNVVKTKENDEKKSETSKKDGNALEGGSSLLEEAVSSISLDDFLSQIRKLN